MLWRNPVDFYGQSGRLDLDEPKRYEDQTVFIIGKRNSGFERSSPISNVATLSSTKSLGPAPGPIDEGAGSISSAPLARTSRESAPMSLSPSASGTTWSTEA